MKLIPSISNIVAVSSFVLDFLILTSKLFSMFSRLQPPILQDFSTADMRSKIVIGSFSHHF